MTLASRRTESATDASAMPIFLPDIIPPDLKSRRQWVSWKWLGRDGKLTKPPVNPHTGKLASSTDSATWGTYDEALRLAQGKRATGVGFVFTPDDPYVGVDLDKCRDPETAEIEPWARETISLLNSYTEVSPSGYGVKIFVAGKLPSSAKVGHVEMYDRSRYFTVTGNHLPETPTSIEERPAEIAQLHSQLKPEAKQTETEDQRPIPIDDLEIIQRAKNASNGARFGRLWDGDWSEYPSQSEADLALASHLMYWTGSDATHTDALFRQSGLYREKWDERHHGDGRTYGQATIEKAIGTGVSSAPHGPSGAGPSTDHFRGTSPTRGFPRTDSGNAELFAHLYGDRVRYDHRSKKWLIWRDHWWAPDTSCEVTRLAKATARQRYQQALQLEDLKEREAEAKWAIASESRQRIEACLALAMTEPPIADSGEGWNSSPWSMGVLNGVIDLRTGDLRPSVQEEHISQHAGWRFNPAAECPRWLQFLDEVFGGDSDLTDFIHRAVGYSLTGDTSEQCIFICCGHGANGKTTFLNTLRTILGTYGYNMPFSTIELNGRTSVPNDVADLASKRLVTASETNEHARLNEARLKALSGGDPVTARFLFREFFEFRPVAKFWLGVNHRPRVDDDSYGFWRRVRLIPFLRQFRGDTAERRLDERLLDEAEGILAWAVRGCLQWRKRGLEAPDAVRVATDEYQMDSDPLATFIEDCCVVENRCQTGASDLFRAYTKWAEKHGLREKEILTSTMFGRRMSNRFHKHHSERGKTYAGIGLKADGFETTLTGLVSDGPRNHNPPLVKPPSRKDCGNPSEPVSPSGSSAHARCKECGANMRANRVNDTCGRCQQ